MIRHTVAVALLALATVTTAAAGTPRIDQRQDNQERRIEEGVRSGELTARETRTLAAREAKIATQEAHAKSDGVVTARERARLHAAQDRTSQSIYRKKHNERDRH